MLKKFFTLLLCTGLLANANGNNSFFGRNKSRVNTALAILLPATAVIGGYLLTKDSEDYDSIGFKMSNLKKEVTNTLYNYFFPNEDTYKNLIKEKAIKGECEELEHLLRQYNIDVNVKYDNNCTLLHIACYYGHTEVAKMLLANGANINAQDSKGCTPLWYAAIENKNTKSYREKIEVFNLLKRHSERLDLNTRNQKNTNLLHLACENGHVELAKLVLTKGIDVNATDNSGKTALDYTIININDSQKHERKLAIANLLIEQPTINLNTSNNHSNSSPLILACSCKASEEYIENNIINLVNKMIKKGALVNATNIIGNTALHYACKTNSIKLAKNLISKGALTNLTNKNSDTAFQYSNDQDFIKKMTNKYDKHVKGLLSTTATNMFNENLA